MDFTIQKNKNLRTLQDQLMLDFAMAEWPVSTDIKLLQKEIDKNLRNFFGRLKKLQLAEE